MLIQYYFLNLLYCIILLYCLPMSVSQQVSCIMINKEYLILSYLILSNDKSCHSLQVANSSVHGIHNVANDNDFSALLTKFPDILTPTFSNPTAKHGVVYYIPTEGPPIHSRTCWLPQKKLAIACDEFRTTEDMGIIRRSTSQWASPLIWF